MRSGLLALRAAGLVAAVVAVPVLGTTAAAAHDSVNAEVAPAAVRPGGEVRITVAGCESPRGAAARSDVLVADSELVGARGGAGASTLTGEAKVKSSAKEGRYAVDVWCDGHEHRRAAVFEVDRDPKPRPSDSPEPTLSAKRSVKPSAKPETSAKPKPSAKPSMKPSSALSTELSPKPSAEPETRPETEPEAEAKPEAKPKPEPGAKRGAEPGARPPGKPETERLPKAASSGDRQASPVAPVSAGGGGRTTPAMAAESAGPGTPHTVIGLVLAGVAAVAVAVRSVRRKRSAARDSD